MKHDESQIHNVGRTVGSINKYLSEFVYGGIDGAVTTFSVVAGAAGAGLDSAIIIILGLANLIADGFSMSVGAYLSAKTTIQNYENQRKIEQWEVENIPKIERQEIVEIYRKKGFTEPLLSQVVDVIIEDKDRWVDVMMKDELEMTQETKSPILIGFMTFLSFILLGFIPLFLYLWDYFISKVTDKFIWASVLTGIAFVVIGFLKSKVTSTSHLKGITETFILGGIAAFLAYYVGVMLDELV